MPDSAGERFNKASSERSKDKQREERLVEYLGGAIAPLVEALQQIDANDILNNKNMSQDWKDELKKITEQGKQVTTKDVYERLKPLKSFKEYCDWLKKEGQEDELFNGLIKKVEVKKWDELVKKFNDELPEIKNRQEKEKLEEYLKKFRQMTFSIYF